MIQNFLLILFLCLAFCSLAQSDTTVFVFKVGERTYKTGYIRTKVQPGDVITPNWGYDPLTDSSYRLPDDTVIIEPLYAPNEANIYIPDSKSVVPGVQKHITVYDLSDSICEKQVVHLFKKKVEITGPKGKGRIRNFALIVHYTDGSELHKTINGNCVWNEKSARSVLNPQKKIACIIYLAFTPESESDFRDLGYEGLTWKVLRCP
jgi:hypothetical protein